VSVVVSSMTTSPSPSTSLQPTSKPQRRMRWSLVTPGTKGEREEGGREGGRGE